VLGAALLAMPFLPAAVAPPSVSASDNPDFAIERLAGPDRYATATAVSRRFFSPGVPVVFVATGEDFPDGLAAGPAADRLGGPVLFVRRTAIPTTTLTELQRLKPQRIVVVGGPGVVSDAVLQLLVPFASGGATRVAGLDRYATAAALSAAYFPPGSPVYVATGELFPDALSAGAAAAVNDAPVLLTRHDSLPAPTAAELARLRPPRIVIVGGVGAVSAAVETALRSYSGQVVRLAGADRYETAVAVANATFPSGAGTVFAATGLLFPDALAAVPAAGLAGGPILLVRGETVPAMVLAELDRLDPDAVVLLGSTAAVPAAVAKAIQHRLGRCWSATKPPAGGQQVFTRIGAATNQVALTFDMGGRLDPALDIVRFLIEHQVCATIFPTAVAAQTTVGRQVMALIAEHPELFEVGNHTVHHCNLRDGGGGSACPASPPSAAFIAAELTGADAIIRPLAGQTTVPFWRPPYGAHNQFVRDAAASAGYTKTVMWHIDTIDWDPDTTTDQIVSRVMGKATSGSIVLMHLGGYHTLDALPTVVSGLRGRGMQLTSLSDMLDLVD
jgi:putative cell wall-binding protein